MERKEEFVDKIIAEDQSLSSFREDEDTTLSASSWTKARETSRSEQINFDDKVRFELENKLFQLICEDDSQEVVSILKCTKAAEVENFTGTDEKAVKRKEYETMMSHLLPKLLHLACKLDSAACAAAILEGYSVPVNALDEHGKTALHHAADSHSLHCLNLLLRKQARTDLRSKDGQIPLETALFCKRMQVDWSFSSNIEDLLRVIGDKDITAVRNLAANTKDVPQIAYRKALDGQVVAFAILLIVATDLIISALVKSHEEPQATIFENLVRKTINLWQIEAQSSNSNVDNDSSKGSTCNTPDSNISQQRNVLFREMELLLHFGVVKPKDTKRLASHASFYPLIRASQAGDEAVVKLLLNGNVDANETDADGNSALHWCIRASSTTQDTRIISLLLRKGASVSHRNMLGLTAVHMAANYGHLQGLQMLLIRDRETVDIVTETKETPLFYAVKNNHVECALLLLRYGANRQALNLRKQRPIDMAKTQDMRMMLSSQSVCHFGKLKEYLTSAASLEMTNWEENEKSLDNLPKFQSIRSETSNQDQQEESSKMSMYTKTEICRYFESPGGCVRGDKCYYAHGEGELRRVKMLTGDPKHPTVGRPLKRVPEDLNRKIFIGGLSPSVESEDLRDFFESKFGPVIDAVVIGSQAGDHIQSRGFGFVTFKFEESVASAVQAHYVTIFGKKVEIKGAVPKSMLELTKGNCHDNIFSSKQDDDDTEPHGRKQIASVLGAEAQMSTFNPPSEFPPWVEKFKTWFPEFLGEVSKRLKEGEWYPLSSLKGDFRATCGMELDHASIGYFKLSDFIRSMPGLCRMKIVPVGRGPATHMVLLESLPKGQHQLLSANQQTIIGNSSFVDKRRSYAAAAGQTSQEYCFSQTLPSSLDDPADHIPLSAFYATAPCPSDFSHSSSKFLTSGSALLYHQSTSTGNFPLKTEEDVRYLTNLLSVFNVNADDSVCMTTNRNALASASTLNQAQPASIPQSNEVMDRSQKSIYKPDSVHNAPTTAPVQYNRPPMLPNSGRGYSFVNFLQEGNSFFTPWTQQSPSYGAETPSWTPTLSRKVWENSPQSVLSPYSPTDSSSQSSPNMDSPSEWGESIKSKCGLCKERKAFWVAVPCAHRALCTECRNNLKLTQMPLNCFICSQPVDKLVALF